MAVATAAVLALDCADPEELAEFYARVLGAEIQPMTTPDRIEIAAPGGSRMAFLRDHGFAPPSWPRPDDSQQAHLDLLVDDIDAAERQVVDLGARPLDTKHNGGLRDTRIYSDPAGHPFALRRT
ncbi:VOC family protein [Streptomyces malaysiensis]|uniref:VOC family protein n=1 Tax=Streptomyces malaysiensis subsp. samsunensis TaxID=459658 RepID=A0A9X2RWB1_STRMQ|nr:VOC family protein [Streptomyces samsunensis]MCQ8831030.1 VOC family protein [Streptomyces samsunensis]